MLVSQKSLYGALLRVIVKEFNMVWHSLSFASFNPDVKVLMRLMYENRTKSIQSLIPHLMAHKLRYWLQPNYS